MLTTQEHAKIIWETVVFKLQWFHVPEWQQRQRELTPPANDNKYRPRLL